MDLVEVVLDAKALLGECPRWDELAQCLYWADIDARQLHRFDPVSGRDEFMQFEQEVGCFALRRQGGFILAMRTGFYFLDEWGGQLRPIVDPEAHLPENRFNDGRCDVEGRFLAGTIYPPKDRGGANLYSLGIDLKVEHLESNILTSNGIAFSPDNRRLYFSDTPRHVIYCYEYDFETGQISDRRVFHQFPDGKGRPDGAAVDVEGCYWSALYEGGRIVRLDPDGEIVQEIPVPAFCPTMVAFGDRDLQSLYITSVGQRSDEELQRYPHSGALFRVRVDVPGQIEYRFGQ